MKNRFTWQSSSPLPECDPRADSYADCQRMLRYCAVKAQRKFGGTVDEWMSCAAVGYLRAYNSYDPDKAAFLTWVWWHIRSAIGNHVHQRMHQMHHEVGLPTDVPARRAGLLSRIWHELSDDARLVVRAVCELPGDLAGLPLVRIKGKARKVLNKHLREKQGWSAARVVDTFAEIEEVLR